MSEAPDADVLIVGAGPAGLAVAACLKRQGRASLILERADRVGHAWRTHYERLHLHTDKGHSGLPGLAMPRHYPRYPSRDQVVDYLEAYARHHHLTPRFNTAVREARRVNGQWQVRTDDGLHLARTLVVATGYNHEPHLPQWPGLARYTGQVLHSKRYRHGAPFRGQRVLVVGLGNSGGELLLDLHEHGAHPSVAVRSPVNVIPREVLGVSYLTMGIWQRHLPARLADRLNAPLTQAIVGDLRPYGLRRPADGPVTQIREQGRVPFIDIGTIGLVKQGLVTVYPDIDHFTPQGVVFSDGRHAAFDAVVLATGFRPAVHHWLQVDAGVLDADGSPLHSGAGIAGQPLYFCGFHISATGMLREIGLEAQAISEAIAAGA